MTARSVLNHRIVYFDEENGCWCYQDDGARVVEPDKPKTSCFGSLLLAARRVRSLSQNQAAALTGISNCNISQLETGIIKNPTARILIALHRGYSLPYDDMLNAIDKDNA